jgi:hypothetical protein
VIVRAAAEEFWIIGDAPASWIWLPFTVNPLVAEAPWLSTFRISGEAMFCMVTVRFVPARLTVLAGSDCGGTSQLDPSFQLLVVVDKPVQFELVWAAAGPAARLVATSAVSVK